MFRSKRLACSFCGRGAADVAKLVGGPGVFICDACVAAADRIIKGDSPAAPGRQERAGFVRRLRLRLRAWFGRHSRRVVSWPAAG
jgi:ClpX C4-type zinc finger